MERIERIHSAPDALDPKLWELLFLADPDRDMVMKYLPQGEMYALFEGDEPVCQAVMFERDDGQLELKNLATDPAHQRKGYARRLIDQLCARYATRYQTLYVGTAFYGLYEHMGFSYAYTIPRFFTDNYPEPVYDEGRQCVDMLYFKRTL